MFYCFCQTDRPRSNITLGCVLHDTAISLNIYTNSRYFWKRSTFPGGAEYASSWFPSPSWRTGRTERSARWRSDPSSTPSTSCRRPRAPRDSSHMTSAKLCDFWCLVTLTQPISSASGVQHPPPSVTLVFICESSKSAGGASRDGHGQSRGRDSSATSARARRQGSRPPASWAWAPSGARSATSACARTAPCKELPITTTHMGDPNSQFQI